MAVHRFPVHLEWTGAGGPGANIWHIRTNSLIPADEETELGGAVSAIRSFYQALVSAGIFRPFLKISGGPAVNVETLEATEVPWTTLDQGNVGGIAPPVLQIVCTWRTSSASRRGRGRTFLGPLNSAMMQNDGTIVDGSRTAITTAATALLNASTAANDWAVGVYGLQSPNTGPDGPRVLRDITGMTLADKFAVLRSRRD